MEFMHMVWHLWPILIKKNDLESITVRMFFQVNNPPSVLFQYNSLKEKSCVQSCETIWTLHIQMNLESKIISLHAFFCVNITHFSASIPHIFLRQYHTFSCVNITHFPASISHIFLRQYRKGEAYCSSSWMGLLVSLNENWLEWRSVEVITLFKEKSKRAWFVW